MGLLIESGEFFAVIGLPDDDAFIVEGVEIVGVEGLSDFEHHVVGEINEE